MKPNPEFASSSPEFWASVRIIGQYAGYTERGTGTVIAHDIDAMRGAVAQVGLDPSYLMNEAGGIPLAVQLQNYFVYRANLLNSEVEPHLMDAQEAKNLFRQLRKEYRPSCPLPANKQKGTKKAPAYFTGIINMLIEANCQEHECTYDPRTLTIITSGGRPLRVSSRRMDGCFPSAIDPVAVWEIKEYYYTTTFGSRIADAVYETIMDGMELQELRSAHHRDVKHYLMVDSHYTWWDCGRPYLCRIIDALNMGYLDEALFGSEVVERLPALVHEWIAMVKQTGRDL